MERTELTARILKGSSAKSAVTELRGHRSKKGAFANKLKNVMSGHTGSRNLPHTHTAPDPVDPDKPLDFRFNVCAGVKASFDANSSRIRRRAWRRSWGNWTASVSFCFPDASCPVCC